MTSNYLIRPALFAKQQQPSSLIDNTILTQSVSHSHKPVLSNQLSSSFQLWTSGEQVERIGCYEEVFSSTNVRALIIPRLIDVDSLLLVTVFFSYCCHLKLMDYNVQCHSSTGNWSYYTSYQQNLIFFFIYSLQVYLCYWVLAGRSVTKWYDTSSMPCLVIQNFPSSRKMNIS